jgi:hypothetical protein
MKVVALILIGFLAQQARPGATSTIRGVVLRSGTSTPVDKAVVELRAGKAPEPRAVITTSNGRFEFLNVPSGSYQLTASRSGYLDTSFGQRGASGSGRELKVESGTTVDNLQLLMTATGAIAGRVFDDTGEPLAKITVRALKYSYVDGERSLVEVGSETTNDLGEFRLFWLPPGQYYVSAVPEGSGGSGKFFSLKWEKGKMQGGEIRLDTAGVVFFDVDRGLPGASAQRNLVPVYYPGTPDSQLAATVEVRSGADVRGIDFRLSRVVTRKVRGTLIDGVTGQPTSQGSLSLVARNAIDGSHHEISPSENGTFEFTGVRPGSYLVVANAMISSEGSDSRSMGGTASIDVGESDLNNVVVTLQRAIPIEGAITLEGQATLPAEIFPEVRLVRSGVPRTGSFDDFISEYEDTSNTRFRLPNVLEGDYRLKWESSDALPPGVYLKSATFGPVDALNSSIHIDQRTRDRLQIVLGANAGSVTGTVVDRERKTAPGVKVAVVPDAARRQRNDLYQTAVSDESGRFQFERIPPGDYLVFAWEDVEDGIWRDAEFMRRHASSGRALHIVEGGRDTVEIVAIPSGQ